MSKLAGDQLEAFFKKIGADKAAEIVSQKFNKKPCGCAQRRDKINEFHQKLKRRKG